VCCSVPSHVFDLVFAFALHLQSMCCFPFIILVEIVVGVVTGTEVNMSARLVAKAETGTALVSETVYHSTKYMIGYDMSDLLDLKGREGQQRGFRPFGRKKTTMTVSLDPSPLSPRLNNTIFVGREKERALLKDAVQSLIEPEKDADTIGQSTLGKAKLICIKGLSGMGKSAIVQQFRRDLVGKVGHHGLVNAGIVVSLSTIPFYLCTWSTSAL
jgi:hypothetical protein